jgi:hypothetical protein
MKNVQVYISDELIDLVPGQAIAMTYQLNAIGDIKNQLANFSNVFKGARTKGNDRKLGFAGDVSSRDKRPYRLLPARIIIDGEDVVTQGYATIKKTDKYYNILVYSGLLDLYTKLDDKKLKDLNLAEFDHVLTLDNIVAYMSSTAGICYPVIDYGAFIMENTILAEHMRFSIYVKEVIERIFTDAGFEFTGSFFEHPHYPKLLMPFTNDKLTDKTGAEAGSFEAENENYAVTNLNVFTNVGGFSVTKGNSAGNFDGVSYTVGAYAVRGKLNFEGFLNDAFGGTQQTALRVLSSTKGILAYIKQPVGTGAATVKLTTENIDLEAGEVVTLQVQHNNAAGVTVSGKLTFVQDQLVPFHGRVPVAENLPDLKQKDFLKAIAQIYGLIFDIDLENQQVRVRFFDDIIDNKARAKDWSAKLDLSIQDDVTYDLGFAQKNTLSYNNGTEEGEEDAETLADDGSVPFSLGRGVILSDNKTLKEENELADLPFAATEELLNTIVDGEEAALVTPRIKMLLPTSKVDNITFDSGGNVSNQTPYYYNQNAYGAPPVYNPATTYTSNKRVRYASAVWEWQSAEAASNKTPGVNLDNGDNGTNYAGLPYWKLVATEDTLLFKQTIKVKPRILLATTMSGHTLQVYSEQYPANLSKTGAILPIFSGALDFTTRVEGNYQLTTDTASDTKCVRAYFTLSPSDVRNIDFLVPIYVGYYSNFFYLSRLDKYQQGQSTAADLVKI